MFQIRHVYRDKNSARQGLKGMGDWEVEASFWVKEMFWNYVGLVCGQPCEYILRIIELNTVAC